MHIEKIRNTKTPSAHKCNQKSRLLQKPRKLPLDINSHFKKTLNDSDMRYFFSIFIKEVRSSKT